MLVTIGVIGILAALLMPALSGAKSRANSIGCLNNIRQVGLALTMYAGDHDGYYPARRKLTNAWPTLLLSYYKDPKILKCPSDSFASLPVGTPVEFKVTSQRSYVINGFNDWFRSELPDADYQKFLAWKWPTGMRESAIPNPSETIVFGEKKKGSGHMHMDFSQGKLGNDVEQIDQGRHGSSNSRQGGANFAFADGSARYLKFGQSTAPQNLWAVKDEWRNVAVKQQ